MVNSNELRAEIVRKGYTQKEIAEKMNISPKTLSNKMRKGVFGSDEIEKLMSILEIADPVPIFFSQRVT